MPRIPTSILSSSPQGARNPAAINGRSVAPASSTSSGPAQPQEQFRVRSLNRTQTAVGQALGRAKSQPDSDQNVIPGVIFVANTQQAVQHGLQRAWRGCALVTPIGGFLSYEVAHNADARVDALSVLVTCANNVTADVVVW